MRIIFNLIHWIFNVILRIVFGAIGIFVFNYILTHTQWNISIGINYNTLGVIGLFGLPGFAALYGIVFCISVYK